MLLKYITSTTKLDKNKIDSLKEQEKLLNNKK